MHCMLWSGPIIIIANILFTVCNAHIQPLFEFQQHTQNKLDVLYIYIYISCARICMHKSHIHGWLIDFLFVRKRMKEVHIDTINW